MRTLITNGNVVTADGSFVADVLIDGEVLSRGTVIVRDGEFTGRKGHGQFIPRGPAEHVRIS